MTPLQNVIKEKSINWNDCVSVLSFAALTTIYDSAAPGYSLHLSSESFIESKFGIFLWAEHDGSIMLVDGEARAQLRQSADGPYIELSRLRHGEIIDQKHIRCVDLIGIAPATRVEEKIEFYRDVLTNARDHQQLH